MTNPDLYLESLRQLRADNANIVAKLGEISDRLSRVELAIAGMRREQAGDAEFFALQMRATERLEERVRALEEKIAPPA